MKKRLTILLGLVLCLAMVGCGAKKNQSLTLDHTLLSKDFTFYSTNSQQTLQMSEYLYRNRQDAAAAYISEYAFFDLDSDGKDELICRLGAGTDTYSSAVIFHAIGDTIYGYDFTYREIQDLKSDGTIAYSHSGFHFGFRKFIVYPFGCRTEAATYCIEGPNGESYYLENDKASTEEAFKSAYARWKESESVSFQKGTKETGFFQYFHFMSGRQKGVDRDGTEIQFQEYITQKLPGSFQDIEYGFYDLNHDGNNELCVRLNGAYAFFTRKDNRVAVWAQVRSFYTYPLENGDLLFERHGGGPTHIDYEYYVLDSNGDVEKTIAFSEWYSAPVDDEINRYYFNDEEVSKEEYFTLVSPYLAHKRAPIQWLSN